MGPGGQTQLVKGTGKCFIVALSCMAHSASQTSSLILFRVHLGSKLIGQHVGSLHLLGND